MLSKIVIHWHWCLFIALFIGLNHYFLKCFQKAAHLRGCLKTMQNIGLLKLVYFSFYQSYFMTEFYS